MEEFGEDLAQNCPELPPAGRLAPACISGAAYSEHSAEAGGPGDGGGVVCEKARGSRSFSNRVSSSDRGWGVGVGGEEESPGL